MPKLKEGSKETEAPEDKEDQKKWQIWTLIKRKRRNDEEAYERNGDESFLQKEESELDI